MIARHFGNNRRRHNNSPPAETFRFVARRYMSQSDLPPYLSYRPGFLHIAIDPDQGFQEKLSWIEVPDEG